MFNRSNSMQIRNCSTCKTVKVRLGIPGDDLIIERTAPTFEDAVVDCADVLQDQIIKMKEKRFGK